MKEGFRQELAKYAKVDLTEKDIRDMENEMKDAAVNHERSLHVLEEKLRALADKVTSVYAELNEEVQRRALTTQIIELSQALKGYALASDQTTFKQECMPKLKFCMETISQFQDRLAAQDGAIMRVDEVLLQKASKWDVKVVGDRMDGVFTKDGAQKEFERIRVMIDRMQVALDHYVATEGERFAAQTGPDYGNDVQRLAKTLELKADRADLAELFALKANRLDGEEMNKIQEVVQRQLQYLSATVTGFAKLSLVDPHPHESKGLRTQQKQQVLMQAESLWKWILNKSPPGNLQQVVPGKGRLKETVSDRVAEMERQNRLAERLGIVKKGPVAGEETGTVGGRSVELPGIPKAPNTAR